MAIALSPGLSLLRGLGMRLRWLGNCACNTQSALAKDVLVMRFKFWHTMLLASQLATWPQNSLGMSLTIYATSFHKQAKSLKKKHCKRQRALCPAKESQQGMMQARNGQLTFLLHNTLFFVLSHSILRDFKYFVQNLQQSAKCRVKSWKYLAYCLNLGSTLSKLSSINACRIVSFYFKIDADA